MDGETKSVGFEGCIGQFRPICSVVNFPKHHDRSNFNGRDELQDVSVKPV